MNRLDEFQSLHKTNKIKTSKMFALFLALLFTLIVGLLFVNSPFFIIGTVTVDGNDYVSDEDIARIAGIPAKTNIFKLNTENIRSQLLKDLRIADAHVERRLPNDIIITVIERKPLAYIACSYGFVEMDKNGVVLTAHKNLKHVKVPIITGINLHTVYIGDVINEKKIKGVLDYLSGLSESSINKMSEINISSEKQVLIYSTDANIIKAGPLEKLSEKSKATDKILNELNDRLANVEYIDLAYALPIIKFKK